MSVQERGYIFTQLALLFLQLTFHGGVTVFLMHRWIDDVIVLIFKHPFGNCKAILHGRLLNRYVRMK